MTTVNTLGGPISSDALGATLIHEHLFVKNPELEANFPVSSWDEDARVAWAASVLDGLVAQGITSFVDLTVMGLGRDIKRVQRVAERTRMNIIAATGYYTTRDLPQFFHTHRPGGLIDTEPLTQMFIDDLTTGIAGTSVRAAMIKVVTDVEGITPDVERVLSSAATASHETGAPITTHTHAPTRTGLLQQEYLAAAGVPLQNVLIGHCGDTTDVSYLEELMRNGSTIGLDRFGSPEWLDDDTRIDTMIHLLERGFAAQITISHDAPLFSINRPDEWRKEHAPHWNTSNITERILPTLRARGVDEATITQILVHNPARILAGHAAVAPEGN